MDIKQKIKAYAGEDNWRDFEKFIEFLTTLSWYSSCPGKLMVQAISSMCGTCSFTKSTSSKDRVLLPKKLTGLNCSLSVSI